MQVQRNLGQESVLTMDGSSKTRVTILHSVPGKSGTTIGMRDILKTTPDDHFVREKRPEPFRDHPFGVSLQFMTTSSEVSLQFRDHPFEGEFAVL
ncbi:hypothetical protein M0R45_008685 [Rubus argutus]|uniref:Uncharacterized protein n=1 Tax=Rubus argutus TaxID=59490 RepID=A0AAW1Y208_RUBAR